MRDWLISRQRYWGAPIPIIYCSEHGMVSVPESDLPVLLPDVDDFQPRGDGKSVLAAQEDWVQTTCSVLRTALKESGLIKVGVKKAYADRSEEHTSELQSRRDLVCRLLLEKKKKT